ncbi:MAG TPA: hypothetical protein VGM25_10700 [Caulobacteraceae bacterium]|jgi:hypothetical protein
MRFLRLGFIAAMAAALCGQQALAADAPPKMDPKVHEQSQKDAPALVQATGMKCDVTDAYQLGTADETVNGKKFKSAFYEIACGQGGLGYIFKSVPGGDPQFFDCLSLKMAADKAIADKQKPSNTCGMLTANADPKTGLLPWLTQAGVNCGQVTNGAWLGASPADKIAVYEASCSNGGGYLIMSPQQGSTKMLDVEPCYKGDLLGVKCQVTSPAEIAKPILAMAAAAKKPECMPTKARWVVTDTANNSDFYEIGCADGKSAYMLHTDNKGGFKETVECVKATRIAGGCTYMDVNTGSTAENATYSKLAKQIGYDACANVQKYQSYGPENGGQREIVELSCSPTEGAFAIVPTGAGQTGEYFNCVRAAGRGLTCHLTPMDVTYAKITQQISSRGKTTCKVTNGKDVGKDDKGTDYVDVACSPGDPQPEMVLQYSKLPQETLAQATTCAQAPIANACTFAGASAKK